MPIPQPDNMDKTKEGFDLLPNGVYDVEVADAEERKAGEEAKFPGSDYIWCELHIIDEEYEGRRVWTNLSFTPTAIGMTKSNLRALGYTDDDFADPNFEYKADDLIGRKAKAVVGAKKNNKTQEMNNNVKRLIPLDEAESALPG